MSAEHYGCVVDAGVDDTDANAATVDSHLTGGAPADEINRCRPLNGGIAAQSRDCFGAAERMRGLRLAYATEKSDRRCRLFGGQNGNGVQNEAEAKQNSRVRINSLNLRHESILFILHA